MAADLHDGPDESGDDGGPIDFAALDPKRNGARWEAMVAAASQGRPRAPVHSLFAQLHRTAGPTLALAAALALVAWLPRWLRAPVGGESGTQAVAVTGSEQGSLDAVWALDEWAVRGSVAQEAAIEALSGGEAHVDW